MKLPARIAQLNRPVNLKRPKLNVKSPKLDLKRPAGLKRPQLGGKRPRLDLKRPQLPIKRPQRPQGSRRRPQLNVKRPQLSLGRPGNLKLPSLSGLGGLARRSGGGEVVGLDIQPGFIAAVQARVNGTIVAERAASVELPADTVRDGEVFDEALLSEAIRELFRDSGLGKRVRVGVANQRTVLRTLELPPVTDQKELAAAVAFQAQDQVPMPLNNAVLDFHPLGIVDTPAGPRQRVVLVAAQRDMIERLLSAVRGAGLTPEGVDLSAFALIRSLYRADPEQTAREMYLNVDGLTNLAIAEGRICRFTRVVGGGLEAIAIELAERRGIALAEARALLTTVDLRGPEQAAPALQQPSVPLPDPQHAADPQLASEPAGEPDGMVADAQPAGPGDAAELPSGMTLAEQAQAELAAAGIGDDGDSDAGHPPAEASAAPAAQDAQAAAEPRGDYDFEYETGQGFEQSPAETTATVAADAAEVDRDVRDVLENGIRDISGEVRNSLDFHRSQDGGGEVSHVVLSGAAEQIPGFAELLQLALGVEVRGQSVALADSRLQATVSQHRLAVAAGLATMEAPQ
jgi:type IV pilus assembly protein PilM